MCKYNNTQHLLLQQQNKESETTSFTLAGWFMHNTDLHIMTMLFSMYTPSLHTEKPAAGSFRKCSSLRETE
uniref:Uncharacterized protein n=1 Tax=Ixodes ricinus TaxID=34613 RepID=A0A131Y320_IXORI